MMYNPALVNVIETEPYTPADSGLRMYGIKLKPGVLDTYGCPVCSSYSWSPWRFVIGCVGEHWTDYGCGMAICASYIDGQPVLVGSSSLSNCPEYIVSKLIDGGDELI